MGVLIIAAGLGPQGVLITAGANDLMVSSACSSSVPSMVESIEENSSMVSSSWPSFASPGTSLVDSLGIFLIAAQRV